MTKKRTPDLYSRIRPGKRVTIRLYRRGGDPEKTATGRAVMLGPFGWVLNMGGPHGRPDIATRENIVAVSGTPKSWSEMAREEKGKDAGSCGGSD